MTHSRNGKMERWRENRGGKRPNRKHGCCYLEGGVRVTTGVSYLSNMHISLCKVCEMCVDILSQNIIYSW